MYLRSDQLLDWLQKCPGSSFTHITVRNDQYNVISSNAILPPSLSLLYAFNSETIKLFPLSQVTNVTLVRMSDTMPKLTWKIMHA